MNLKQLETLKFNCGLELMEVIGKYIKACPLLDEAEARTEASGDFVDVLSNVFFAAEKSIKESDEAAEEIERREVKEHQRQESTFYAA